MSIATIAAQLLQEAGVTPADILAAANTTPEGAVTQLASELGVDLSGLAKPAEAVEITDGEVAQVRAALTVLNKAFQ